MGTMKSGDILVIIPPKHQFFGGSGLILLLKRD